jgi:hypothetical protein
VNSPVLRIAWYRFRITLARRRAGYLTIVLLVGLVGGIALGSLTAARRTEASYPKFLAGTNPSDLFLQPTTTLTNVRAFNAQLAGLPHVAKVESAVSINAATLTPSGGFGTILLVQAELLASPNGLFANVDRLTMLEGRRPNPVRIDEIVVSPAAASLFHLHVGSHLPVGIDRGKSQNIFPLHRKLDLTVVGIGVFNIQIIQDDVDRDATAFILGTPALYRALAPCCTGVPYEAVQISGGSRYAVPVEHEYNHLVNTSRYTNGQTQLQVYVTSVIEAEAQRAIRPEAIALAIFGFIAALAALLIALQAISRQLFAAADDVETLRALGAGPSSTAADGLLGIAGSVVLGALLAVGVAIGLSPLSLFGPVRAADPSPGIDVDWTVLGLGTAFFVVVLGGVAALIAIRSAPHRGGARRRRAADRSSGVVRAATSIRLAAPAVAGLRLALEPGRGRTSVPVRSTIAGAVLALAVVVATITFGASLNALVSHPALYGWNFNYAFFSTDGYGPIPGPLAHRLLSHDPSVAASTGVYFGTFEIDNETVPAIAGPVGAAVVPPLLSGHGLERGNQIVLGTSTLLQLHKRVGDTVVLQGDGVGKVRLRIVGTATLPTIGETLGNHPSMSTGALFSTAVVPRSLLTLGLPPSLQSYAGPNAIFVRLHASANPQTAFRSLQVIDRKLLAEYHTAAAVSFLGTSGSNGITISLLSAQRPAEIVNYRTMGATPAILATGLAGGTVVALGLTLVASVRRRRREFALLKVFGFTTRQLGAAVAWQSTVTVAIGLVIGVPLGIVFGRSMWVLFAHELSAVSEPTIPIPSIAITIAVALVLANVIAAIPARLAARSPTTLLLRAE